MRLLSGDETVAKSPLIKVTASSYRPPESMLKKSYPQYATVASVVLQNLSWAYFRINIMGMLMGCCLPSIRIHQTDIDRRCCDSRHV